MGILKPVGQLKGSGWRIIPRRVRTHCTRPPGRSGSRASRAGPPPPSPPPGPLKRRNAVRKMHEIRPQRRERAHHARRRRVFLTHGCHCQARGGENAERLGVLGGPALLLVTGGHGRACCGGYGRLRCGRSRPAPPSRPAERTAGSASTRVSGCDPREWLQNSAIGRRTRQSRAADCYGSCAATATTRVRAGVLKSFHRRDIPQGRRPWAATPTP